MTLRGFRGLRKILDELGKLSLFTAAPSFFLPPPSLCKSKCCAILMSCCLLLLLSLSLLFPRKTWKGKSKFSHTRKPWNMQQKLLRKAERNVGKESSTIALA